VPIQVTGQTYVVVSAGGLGTYEALDEAFVLATEVELTASIAADAFELVGYELNAPQTRTLIIANAANEVRSYQAFEIAFHAPP
jgi:hypothetical protein